jgi:hypothetical protein
MGDTLKTTMIGTGSAGVIVSGWLPETVAIIVGALTAIHLLIKIYKEIKKGV